MASFFAAVDSYIPFVLLAVFLRLVGRCSFVGFILVALGKEKADAYNRENAEQNLVPLRPAGFPGSNWMNACAARFR